MKKNNVSIIEIKKRIELYREFALDLSKKIDDTFPGSYKLNKDDFTNHFNWSFNTICETYKKQEIDFTDNNDLKKFMLNFFFDNYYSFTDKEKNINNLINHWKSVFAYKGHEINVNRMSMLTEVFKKFDKSIG